MNLYSILGLSHFLQYWLIMHQFCFAHFRLPRFQLRPLLIDLLFKNILMTQIHILYIVILRALMMLIIMQVLLPHLILFFIQILLFLLSLPKDLYKLLIYTFSLPSITKETFSYPVCSSSYNEISFLLPLTPIRSVIR